MKEKLNVKPNVLWLLTLLVSQLDKRQQHVLHPINDDIDEKLEVDLTAWLDEWEAGAGVLHADH